MYQLRMCELNFANAHQQMLIGWSDIDYTRENRFIMLCLLDALSGFSAEQSGKMTFVRRVEMLHDDNAWHSLRQWLQYFRERQQPASGSTDRNQIILPRLRGQS